MLNLFSLLKARYTTTEQKRQLALLFSLISDPELQPVNEISGILGELDNGTIAAIELLDVSTDDDVATAKDYFRLSSRQGGGFAKNDVQIITGEFGIVTNEQHEHVSLVPFSLRKSTDHSSLTTHSGTSCTPWR